MHDDANASRDGEHEIDVGRICGPRPERTVANPWIRPGRPIRIAHRGHIITLPEQTMAAYRGAIQRGAEMIEADVQRTLDGTLIMIHDELVDRTTDGHGSVSQMSWPELAELDAGSWFSADHAGERIPRLDDLLDLADETGVGLCLEAKAETSAAMALTARSVAEAIGERDALSRHVLASFDHGALGLASRAVPGLQVAPDRIPERGPSDGEELVRQARSVAAPILQHHHSDLTAAGVTRLHDAGIAVWAWPVNDAPAVSRALSLGVDGVMGDDVDALFQRDSGASAAPNMEPSLGQPSAGRG